MSESSGAAGTEGRADRVVVVGLARSGTSWLGRALGRAGNARYYAEPDNIDSEHDGKRPGYMGFGPYPMLEPGQSYPSFAALWDLVFAGRIPKRRGLQVAAGRVVLRAPRPLRDPLLRSAARVMSMTPGRRPCAVVKTIYVMFSIDWLVERYNPRVVVIQRNPLNVISSWMQLGIQSFDLPVRPEIRDRYLTPLGIEQPPAGASQLGVAAWTVGLLTTVLGDAVSRHPQWQRAVHEDLCVESQTKIRAIYDRLGLEWTTESEEFLVQADRPGEGLRPVRVTSEQPDRWKQRLTPAQVDEIEATLSLFPSRGWVWTPAPVATP